MFGIIKDLFTDYDEELRLNREYIRSLSNRGNIKFPIAGFHYDNAHVSETLGTLTFTKIYNSRDNREIDMNTKYKLDIKNIIFGSRYLITARANNADNTFILVITTDMNVNGVMATPHDDLAVPLNILSVTEGSIIKNGYRNVAVKVQIPPYVKKESNYSKEKVESNLIYNLLGNLDEIVSNRNSDGIVTLNMRFTVYASYNDRDNVVEEAIDMDELANRIIF